MAFAATQPVRGLPPGPRGWSRLTATRDFIRDWMGFFERCARDYGDIVFFRFLSTPICLVLHPDGIEYVLVQNPANFTKSSDYRALDPLLGKGLLTSEGALWQAQRKLIQPAFRHEHIVSYAKIMLDSVASMLATWQDGETRDIHEEMMAVTLEIVAKSLFGSDISRDSRGVGKSLSVVMKLFVSQVNLAFLLPERFPVPKTPRSRRAIRQLDEVIYAIVRQRRSAPHQSGDLLQALLEAQDEHGRRMTASQLRDEMMTLLLAGHETTANALSWTWFLLAQNPSVEEYLFGELRGILGNRPPSGADLPRLSCAEMVIKESMRLYPPAWGIGRRAIQGFELGGYYLPAGTNVFLLQWITQRDPRFFPEPQRFDPERWRNDPIRRGSLPRFAYFPFGGGPRVCIGAGFAMMEATLLLAAIVQRFRLSLVPSHRVEMLPSVTLRPKHGIQMILRHRS